MDYPDCDSGPREAGSLRVDRDTSAEEGALSREDRDASTEEGASSRVDDGTRSARRALVLAGALVALAVACGLGALSLCSPRGADSPSSSPDVVTAPDAPEPDTPANDSPMPTQITASSMGGGGSSFDGFAADEVEYTLEITPPTKLLRDGV